MICDTEVGSPKSEGLNTGVRAYIDKPALAKKLNLRAGQVIVLGQSVGYPEE